MAANNNLLHMGKKVNFHSKYYHFVAEKMIILGFSIETRHFFIRPCANDETNNENMIQLHINDKVVIEIPFKLIGNIDEYSINNYSEPLFIEYYPGKDPKKAWHHSYRI